MAAVSAGGDQRGTRGTKRKRSDSAKTPEVFSHGIKLRRKAPQAPSKQQPAVKCQQKIPKMASRSPFPGFPRPASADVMRLHKVLARHFGERHPESRRQKRQILDTVVGTILSQNTTNTNSHRAFRQLIEQFRTWDAVRTAKPALVEASIKCGGLAPKKTKWIQKVLRTVHQETGKTSMEYLRAFSKNAVHADLERFEGIGKKTSAIINLFDVGHPDMAVDTHVFRYALQLGWVPSEEERDAHNKRFPHQHWRKVTRDTVYEHLDNMFPDNLKYSMHLILTDTVGGLPTVCGAYQNLGFDGRHILVDSEPLKKCLTRH